MAELTSADILASVQSANAKAYNPDPTQEQAAFAAEMAANRAAEVRNRAARNRPQTDGSNGGEFFNVQFNSLGNPSLATPTARKTAPKKGK